jgi:alkanesulfonate monooxygenase SsuD/methylene tetrahydromethanopterin reductase-like flavin-dependent oxidoreductase (luciferase family)
MKNYQDAVRRAGRETELGGDLSVGFHFYLADTQEEAIKAASAFYEENVKMFGPLRLHRGLSEQQMADIADPKRAPNAGLPSLEDAVKQGAFLAGPPERVIEQLKAVEEQYPGLDRIGVSHPVGTPQDVVLEQLEWFSKSVMPAFKGKVGTAVPAD